MKFKDDLKGLDKPTSPDDRNFVKPAAAGSRIVYEPRAESAKGQFLCLALGGLSQCEIILSLVYPSDQVLTFRGLFYKRRG